MKTQKELKKTDITWNLDNDNTQEIIDEQSENNQEANESNMEHDLADSDVEPGVTEDSSGFWTKVKNIFKA